MTNIIRDYSEAGLRAFPTHVCDGTHQLAKIGLYNYELEDYFVISYLCIFWSFICDDKALISCHIQHEYACHVHKDLNEIYLCMLKHLSFTQKIKLLSWSVL
jgi:hypothetical protein